MMVLPNPSRRWWWPRHHIYRGCNINLFLSLIWSNMGDIAESWFLETTPLSSCERDISAWSCSEVTSLFIESVDQVSRTLLNGLVFSHMAAIRVTFVQNDSPLLINFNTSWATPGARFGAYSSSLWYSQIWDWNSMLLYISKIDSSLVRPRTNS